MKWIAPNDYKRQEADDAYDWDSKLVEVCHTIGVSRNIDTPSHAIRPVHPARRRRIPRKLERSQEWGAFEPPVSSVAPLDDLGRHHTPSAAVTS